jgi:excisionase family DNA binding protein
MESRFDSVLNPVDKTNSCDVMTLSEAVEYCKLSKPTLVKLIQNGTLPGGLFGSVWRITRGELIAAFKKRLRGNYRG